MQRWVAPLEGVDSVALEFDVMTPDEKTALTQKLRGGISERTKGIALDKDTRVIAIASGKGGVGKSSLTANLAAAFSTLGHKTGVLDADVYGHSIPHMLGVRQRPVVVDKMIVPPVRDDLKLMSIGFFLEDNSPIMWRGPMLHRALEQFLSDVHWGELDMLLVDMPPGTGDVAISLGQLLPRAEAVLVTTPQPAAQEVAIRAGTMAPQDEHAPARRGREHERRGVRDRRRRPPGAKSSACPCSARFRSTRGSASVRTRASRSSGPIRTRSRRRRSSLSPARSRGRRASAASASSKSFRSSPSSVATAATLRRRLVRVLEEKGLLQDKRVRDAFLAVPREHFVPEVDLEAAYRDEAILTKQTETGLGLSSSSQPGIMAEMLGELSSSRASACSRSAPGRDTTRRSSSTSSAATAASPPSTSIPRRRPAPARRSGGRASRS